MTIWDGEARLHGSTDLPLSTSGRASFEHEVQRVVVGKVRTVHHPPDEAATVCAEIFARRIGAKPKSVRDLADPDIGLLEGLTTQVFAERFAKRYKLWQEDPLSLSPPEGEPFNEARSRVFAAVARLLRKARGEEAAIVLHDIGVGLLRCALAERASSQLWKMLKERPHIERYAVPPGMLQKLESLSQPATTA